MLHAFLWLALAPPADSGRVTAPDVGALVQRLQMPDGDLAVTPARLDYRPTKSGGDLVLVRPAVKQRQTVTGDPGLAALVECGKILAETAEYKTLFADCDDFDPYFKRAGEAAAALAAAAGPDCGELIQSERDKLDASFGECYAAFRRARGFGPAKSVLTYQTVIVLVNLATKPTGGSVSLVSALEYELVKLKGRDPDLASDKWLAVTQNPANLGGTFYYRIDWGGGRVSKPKKVKFDKPGDYVLQ